MSRRSARRDGDRFVAQGDKQDHRKGCGHMDGRIEEGGQAPASDHGSDRGCGRDNTDEHCSVGFVHVLRQSYDRCRVSWCAAKKISEIYKRALQATWIFEKVIIAIST